MRKNEEWLVDLNAQGEQQAAALEELRLLLLRGALYTFHRYLADLQSRDEEEVLRLAEDCAQDALLAILRRLPDFRGESKFTTWAYKFAVNIALTNARRERWKGTSIEAVASGDAAPDAGLPLSAGETNPALTAQQNEIWVAIHKIMLEDLTPRQRQVVKLMVFDEIPMDVVVERLDSNRNAIYKLLHDARKKLKQQLEAQGFELEELLSLFDAHR